MLAIPLQAVPSQTLAVTLGSQSCQINVYQLRTGLYFDLLASGTLIIGGVVCENDNRLVRSAYLGFIGDLMFDDTAGSTDPVYAGLGSRYQLLYLTPADLAGFGLAA